MAATGKTPILLYGSTTLTNVPVAGNLTNSSDGCEIAINVADKNLFFKDSTNVVNTVPIRQSNASSNGWLSSTDWNTFNSKVSSQWTTTGSNIYYNTGYVGVGTASPTDTLSLGNSLDVRGASGSALYTGSTDGSTRAFYGAYSGAAYFGTYTNHPVVFRANNSEYMRGFPSGGVSIGNQTDPGATNLSVQGKALVGTATSLGSGVSVLSSDEAAYNLRNSGSSAGKKWTLGANAANTVELYNQSSAGVYIADGGSSWSSISDERLKDIIEPITNASAKVRQLRSVIGKYKTDDEGTRRSFLIAQDVKAAFPEAINEHALPNSDDKTEYLGVTYTDIIPLLVATINELQDRLDALENK